MNKILIFREKHGSRYFDASTDELICKAALKVLTERLEDGYWYYEPEPPNKGGILTPNQIATLPTAALVNQETDKLIRYNQDFRQYEYDLQEFRDIKKSVETKDGLTAYKILRSRSCDEYEYETFQLQNLEKV
jgi:hypothetical protein